MPALEAVWSARQEGPGIGRGRQVEGDRPGGSFRAGVGLRAVGGRLAGLHRCKLVSLAVCSGGPSHARQESVRLMRA